ncbi:MAG TPA: 6-phosphogluconolactonase, partial [Tepidisphaeraceae bacterium]|nr:6-phosphogluconolactonase [Tepidisphaeraceae bacterium]
MFTPEIKTFPNPLLLAIDAAERITVAANQAIAQSGLFSLVLSGGSTPKIVYDRLADEFRERIDWSRVEIYFGDERCVPPDHEQSNFRMANNSLLSKVPIPAENIHRMRGEIDPQQAATEYGQLLK